MPPLRALHRNRESGPALCCSTSSASTCGALSNTVASKRRRSWASPCCISRARSAGAVVSIDWYGTVPMSLAKIVAEDRHSTKMRLQARVVLPLSPPAPATVTLPGMVMGIKRISLYRRACRLISRASSSMSRWVRSRSVHATRKHRRSLCMSAVRSAMYRDGGASSGRIGLASCARSSYTVSDAALAVALALAAAW